MRPRWSSLPAVLLWTLIGDDGYAQIGSQLESSNLQKLSFRPNCRLRGGAVPPAWPNTGLFKLLLPVGACALPS